MTKRKLRRTKFVTNKNGVTKRRFGHYFFIRYVGVGGHEGVIKARADVVAGKDHVDIFLTKEDIMKSLSLGGTCNTQTCAISCSIHRQRDLFKHKFSGFVDLTYGRCWISSRNRADGLPDRAYCYEHNSDVAKHFDTPGGVKKLLDTVERDGPIMIRFRPMRLRSEEGRSGRDRKATGKRTNQIKGHKLRYATGLLGASANTPTATMPALLPKSPNKT